ncbi:MAG: ATP-binding protein [Sulfuritalea sp.]|nr:ATP-binding protein [Sulfuritalea sp.]
MPDDMKRLSDFKPLRQVTLPGLGDLECSGLIVLVGPNSSGKSQLLQDIYGRLSGTPRRLVVASDIQIEKPPLEPFLRCLEDEGYFTTFEDEAGTKYMRPLTMYLGTGQALGQIQPQQAQQWYGSFVPENPQFTRRQSEFLNHFGRLLVTALFLDRRLTSLATTGVIDFISTSPQHDLHALYLDDKAKGLLLEEMVSSFGRSVWPDMSRGNLMSLKVSDEGVLPTAEDRLSHKKMAEFRSIESEGDGMKSYVATCVALLLGRRPVCLIDEPEMCLHPPQAYNLGKFIGRFGASRESATLVATHSSHLLRGVIQTAEHVQIVRLTRREKLFSAHLVPAKELTEALSRPTLRSEAVLDGIFAQAVVVVEADGDRLVYQAAWETLNDDFRIDLHFSTVGGTGGIADTCSLYRTLKIPIAVIADLDIIVDGDRMSRILAKLVDDPKINDALIKSCNELAEAIRNLPPTITPTEFAKELLTISESSMDWDKRDDIELRRRLARLGNDMDRMRRLKRGGIAAYTGELSNKIGALVDQLRIYGLFLVPVGELEQWLAAYNVCVKTSDKRAWSNAAAQTIQNVGKSDGDVWGFMASVGHYLSSRQTILPSE